MNVAPIEIVQKRYKCPGCKRSYSSKSYAAGHVKICQSIEANHSCKTCALFCKAARASPSDPMDSDEPAACSDGIDLTDGLKVNCPAWEVIF